MTAARPLLYGVGTFGRDMMYTLVGFYLVFYLTEVVSVPDATMWWITAVLLSIRIADAFFDPVMGAVVDSTRSRWGQFRPWLAVGGLASAVLTVAPGLWCAWAFSPCCGVWPGRRTTSRTGGCCPRSVWIVGSGTGMPPSPRSSPRSVRSASWPGPPR